MNRRNKILLTAVPLSIILGAGSCDERGLGDAPTGDKIEDERLIIVNADSFPNFAVVCDGTTAIYSHTREAAPFTIENSTLCDGRGREAKGVTEGEVSPVEEGKG